MITVLMVLDIYTFGKKMRKLQNDQRAQPVIRHCESEIQHKGFRDATGQRRFALTAGCLRAEYRSASRFSDQRGRHEPPNVALPIKLILPKTSTSWLRTTSEDERLENNGPRNERVATHPM